MQIAFESIEAELTNNKKPGREMKPVVQSAGNCERGVGVYLVDKPAGVTSFAMVRKIRKALGMKKVGHAGTLDPFATGLLIICAGRPATKLISRLMDTEKVYEATLKLGVETDTQDPEGKVIARHPVHGLAKEQVGNCLAGFIGDHMQVPPRYSALKHKGKPLYYYARRGIDVAKPPRPVTIRKITLLSLDQDLLTIRVTCGKGTYIRTLAADIGAALGTGAYLAALRRTRIGRFSVDNAVAGDSICDVAGAKTILLNSILTVDDVLQTTAEDCGQQTA